MKISEQHIQIESHSLYVRLLEHHDTRPTLIFLHDSLGCIETWRDFPEQIATETGINALIYDRVGYGRSSGFREPRGKNYLHIEALEILPKLLEALEISEAILFGFSDGGSIALIAASQLPQIKGVITEGAHVFVEDKTLEGIRQAITDYQTTDIAKRLERYHGDKVQALYSAWTETWTADWFRDWDLSDVLPKIPCPVLVIQGQEDEFGTLEQVDRIARGVPNAKAMVIPNCGHTPHRQARGEVTEATTQFVELSLTKLSD